MRCPRGGRPLRAGGLILSPADAGEVTKMPECELPAPSVLTVDGLSALFEALQRRDYRLVGPTMRDGAIVYDEIRSPADLPAGWTDEQDGGTYRLKPRA